MKCISDFLKQIFYCLLDKNDTDNKELYNALEVHSVNK